MKNLLIKYFLQECVTGLCKLHTVCLMTIFINCAILLKENAKESFLTQRDLLRIFLRAVGLRMGILSRHSNVHEIRRFSPVERESIRIALNEFDNVADAIAAHSKKFPPPVTAAEQRQYGVDMLRHDLNQIRMELYEAHILFDNMEHNGSKCSNPSFPAISQENIEFLFRAHRWIVHWFEYELYCLTATAMNEGFEVPPDDKVKNPF